MIQMDIWCESNDGCSVLTDDQSWATFVSGMMLMCEAFNIRENDTVCAAFSCAKPVDQPPIVMM